MKQTDTSKTLANAFTDWVDVLGREVARLYEAGTLQFTIKDDGKVGFQAISSDFIEFLKTNTEIYIYLAQIEKSAARLNLQEGFESKLEEAAFNYVRQNLSQAIHLTVVKTITESFLFAYDEVITPTKTQATKSVLRHVDLFFGEQHRQGLNVKLRKRGEHKKKTPEEIEIERKSAPAKIAAKKQERGQLGDPLSPEYGKLSTQIYRERKKIRLPQRKK